MFLLHLYKKATDEVHMVFQVATINKREGIGLLLNWSIYH